jgi:hypothetical protein
MPVKVLRRKRLPVGPRENARRSPPTTNKLTIHDLGWTRERAREVRAKLAAFAVDWDDPKMDIYKFRLKDKG